MPDGTTLIVGEYHAVPDVPRRTLVTGGARSGKSLEAERRLETFPDVLYVATGGTRDGDAEWAARVSAAPRAAARLLAYRRDLRSGTAARRGRAAAADRLPVAVADRRDGPGGRVGRRDAGRRAASVRCASGSPNWSAAVRQTARTVVAVTNEVGSGVVPATASGRRFRDELGRLNAAFAAECEHVLLVVAGQAAASCAG